MVYDDLQTWISISLAEPEHVNIAGSSFVATGKHWSFANMILDIHWFLLHLSQSSFGERVFMIKLYRSYSSTGSTLRLMLTYLNYLYIFLLFDLFYRILTIPAYQKIPGRQ